MHYIIRHHAREIRYDGYPYFVTHLFGLLIEGLRTRYPEHTFDVQVDDAYESFGYGGIHSCMHLSVWHPGTRKYILVSLFDNWRHHFDRSLGWEPDRMVQFFYGGGFDYAEYFRFRQLCRSNSNLAFPDEIKTVYRELPYVPFRDGLDAEMEHLYLWPKRPPPKMLFRGWLWEPRKLMVADLQRDDIVISDTNDGGDRLGVVDYLTEMTEYRAALSLPGCAPLCHRDIEAFAVGVPVIRPYVTSNQADPLLPGVHYICCYQQPDYGDDGYARYLSYRDFQSHLVQTWDRVKDDREFLAFIASNARAWYVRNCTMDRQVTRLLGEIDLGALEEPADGHTDYAALLKVQPPEEDVLGETNWLWVKEDTSSWPGPRGEWINEHDTKYFRHLRAHHTVVTAGANCGLHARMFALRFTRVYAFEPDALNFHCLVNNCQFDHVVKMMCALGDENRLVGLHRSALDQCGSHRIDARAADSHASVPMLTIDSLGLDRCDLIQLDVEGFEDRVLVGARDTIRRCSPVVTVETRGGIDAPAVIAVLTSLDYQRVDLSASDSVWIPAKQAGEDLVKAVGLSG